jgi:hypothetical protein
VKPVDQIRFGSEEGDCLVSCIASIFEAKRDDPLILELDAVHQVTVISGDHELWNTALVRACRAFGWGWSVMQADEYPNYAPPGYTVACGVNAAGSTHAVVAWNGIPVHDPHPRRAGLVAVEYFIIFYRLYSTELVAKRAP